jgi:type II secretory pathway component PulL
MIEINLIPDVKLELLKARRQQRTVISISILVAIASIAVLALMAFYAFGVQTIANNLADNGIDSESKELRLVKDLDKTLTIQSQLDTLQAQHDKKLVASRIFDIISTTVPTGENVVTISNLKLDAKDGIIELEGQAANGYEALEVFRKTISQTKFQYSLDNEAQKPVNIASSISDGERQYGQDSEGKRVLRFALSFKYAEELFSPLSKSGKVVAPNRQNATDSASGVPKSLFSASVESENE